MEAYIYIYIHRYIYISISVCNSWELGPLGLSSPLLKLLDPQSCRGSGMRSPNVAHAGRKRHVIQRNPDLVRLRVSESTVMAPCAMTGSLVLPMLDLPQTINESLACLLHPNRSMQLYITQEGQG